MSLAYWVTCTLDPWAALEQDEAFGEIASALREDGEYSYGAIELSLHEGAPSFVPEGSVVLHVTGRPGAEWDEVLELLDAFAAAGEGVVVAEDRQIVLDRRSVRPGVRAFKESPAWAADVIARHPEMTVVVFATSEPKAPRAELSRVGLQAIAARVTDAGFWNASKFGDVVCESIPRGPALDALARQAGVDPARYTKAMKFVRTGTGSWTDALVSAQILVHATKGRGFVLGRGGEREELPP